MTSIGGLVSIIVPVYNVEKYLERCIKSIISQSYRNFELILIDDGSTDDSGNICDAFSSFDDRIIVIHTENSGVSESRNLGIEKASGEYISFIDSDDWVDSDYIKTLYDLSITRNADIVMCDLYKAYDDIPAFHSKAFLITEYSNYQALEKMFGEQDIIFSISCSKLIKINILKDIRFPPNRRHEDQFTTYKFFCNANKIVYTSEELYYYFQRHDSFMKSKYQLSHRVDLFDAFWERALRFDQLGYVQLRDRTYKRLFYISRGINNYLFEHKNEIIPVYLKSRQNKLYNHLQISNQNIVFRVGYKLYYLYPNLYNFILSIRGKVKSYIANIIF